MIVVDRIDRVAEARARSAGARCAIARQSVLAGMGLSARRDGRRRARAPAAGGGALLQEGIDVAVILNALRALRG